MKINQLAKRLLWGALALFLLYFGSILCYGLVSDWQPEDTPQTLAPDQNAAMNSVSDSVLTLLSWNVGYGGLGAESDFFFDDQGLWYSGSSMVRSPEQAVQKNIAGALRLLQTFQDSVDFFLLQEVDVASDRSYGQRQYEAYQKILPGFAADMALNYQCERVPIPLLEPWNAYGKVLSGLATLSRYQPAEVVRHQLPGHYPFPSSIFQLDRCASLHRYPTRSGKTLVIINLHNSAYDPGDKIKAIQLPYLRDLALAEYDKGNYVILGGDWNQCPPHFRFDSFMPGNAQGYTQGSLPPDFFPEDWTFAYDPGVPTNRKARDPYQKGKTFETLIDYFLVSPNLQLKMVHGISQEFQFSDHQPVLMTVKLQ